jgi:hypothetical protein
MSMTYSFHVTGSDGSEAKVEGDMKAVDSIETAIAYMGAKWNEEVEAWDFGYYTGYPSTTTRPLYKVAGAIIEAHRATGRVPAGLVDELARAIVETDKFLKAARGDENDPVEDQFDEASKRA